MKFACNSNVLRKISFEDALYGLAEIGFQGIEVSLHPVQLHPLVHDDKYIHKIQKLLDSTGLEISNFHTGARGAIISDDFEPSFITDDKAGRDSRIDYTKKSIDMALKMNIDVVSVASGVLKDGQSSDVAWRNLEDGLKKCLDYAEGRVYLAVEPEPNMLIENIPDGLRLIKNIKSEFLGINFDIGHAYCFEENIPEIVHQYHPLIKHIHLEDIKNRIHKHLIPGTGDIDFLSVFNALKEINYNRFVSLELYTYEEEPFPAIKESFHYVSQFIN